MYSYTTLSARCHGNLPPCLKTGQTGHTVRILPFIPRERALNSRKILVIAARDHCAAVRVVNVATSDEVVDRRVQIYILYLEVRGIEMSAMLTS